MIILCITVVFLAVFLFYLWLIHPDSRRRKDCMAFSSWNFAHRGLWNMDKNIPENSLPAFQEAVRQGYAIELDVRLTADGRLAVFHDDTLQRMCGLNRPVESMTSDELSHLRLLHTQHHIPLLSEVLELVNGRVPLLIEMKLPTRDMALCPALDRLLHTYQGLYLIESFNSLGLRWYRKRRPSVLRGQLSCRSAPAPGLDGFLKKLLAALIVNCTGRPHFIACNYLQADGLGLFLNRHLYGAPIFAWTVRSPEDFRECREKYCSVIFEGFLPQQSEPVQPFTSASGDRKRAGRL